VGIADAHGLVHDTERGLDVPALLADRRLGGLIDRAALPVDVAQLPGDGWLDVDAEVAVPAATSYSITESDARRVRARLLAEAANVPVTRGAEALLAARGVPVIPDFVANAGAAAWAWWVIFGLVTDADSSRAMVSTHVRLLVRRLFEAWNEDGTDLRDLARTLAVDRSTALIRRFGSVAELVPLFDADLLAARATTPQLVSTTDPRRR